VIPTDLPNPLRTLRRLSFLPLLLSLWSGLPSSLVAQSLQITRFAGGPGGGGFLDGPAATARFNTPSGATVDSEGNVFIADAHNHVIRKISPAGAVTTFAGSPGMSGSADGNGSAARFNLPTALATDQTPQPGNVYVADSLNYTIRRITASGVVSTLAGSPGVSGSADGPGSTALFEGPAAVATDSVGNLYVIDAGVSSNTIRKITPAGVVSTLAGSPGTSGSTDGPGPAARFDFGEFGALATDTAGNLYVADSNNGTIRKVTPAGVVSTLAGTPGGFGTADGTGPLAQFAFPVGIALDPAGNLYVADGFSSAIRQVTPAGVVTTIAGTSSAVPDTFGGSAAGLVDGPGPDARFNVPLLLASDGKNLYVPDLSNNAVRKIVIATAVVTTLAGGSPVLHGSVDAIGTAARFSSPFGLATDGANLYVSDWHNRTIRSVVIATGQVATLAGSPGLAGVADGTGSAARFRRPSGVTTDGTSLYVADSQASTIRRVVIATGQVTTLAGSPGVTGSSDGIGNAALFNSPSGMATDGVNLYVADDANGTIRKIVISTRTVSTLAGTPGVFGSSDGIGGAASFNLNRPTGNPISVGTTSSLATDGTNLYVPDTGNGTIRKIVIATGEVTTIAGGPGVFFSLRGIATDGPTLYVADLRTIRAVAIATGQVSTLAGDPGWSGGMDGAGAGALFFQATGIAFVNNTIFVVEAVNNDIRKGVCGADDPVSPVISPEGNTTGPVTGIDYLNLAWSPPASGLTPNGYDWAINGDPFVAESGTSVTAPPRGSNSPITLHVRSRACSPEVAGTAVDSPTYSPAPPVASFSGSSAVSPGTTVTFTDTSTPQATSWLWLFGDGSYDTKQSTSHAFSSTGIYSVVLIATNGAGSSEVTNQQTVQSTVSVLSDEATTRSFDATDPGHQRLHGVQLRQTGKTWLKVTAGGNEETIVYLRFLDARGASVLERRLSVASGQEAFFDVAAYGLRGTYTLEAASTKPFQPSLIEVPIRRTRVVARGEK